METKDEGPLASRREHGIRVAFGLNLLSAALVSGTGPETSDQHRYQTEGNERQDKTSAKAQHRVACCRPVGRRRSPVFIVESDRACREKNAHHDTYRRRPG